MSTSANYTRDDEANGALFQVVPADGPRLWPLVAVGALVLWFGFSGISFILVFLVAGACIKLGLSDLRPLEHRTSVRFRVSPAGIDALGETFRKADIDELVAGVGGGSEESPLGSLGAKVAGLHQAKLDAVMHTVNLRSRGRTIILAGGMDAHTASMLLTDIKDALAGAPPQVQVEASLLGTTRPALTVGRVSAGLIGIEVRAFTGEFREHPVGEKPPTFALFGPDGQIVPLSDEPKWVPMKIGDRVRLYWGIRRGESAHKINQRSSQSDNVHRGFAIWGVVSRPITITNCSSGASVMVPQPFNRMIIPNPTIYIATFIVVVFGGLFSLLGAMGGSPEAILFLPFAVWFFIWMKKRQGVLMGVIREAEARLKQSPPPATAPAISLDGTIPAAEIRS